MENKDPEKKPKESTPAPETTLVPDATPAADPASADSTDEPSKDAKQFGMLCHLTALAGVLVGGFGNWIGPLVIWLLKKEEFPFVDDQGKEALNFQITCLIGFLIGLVTIPLLIGMLIIPVVGVLWVVFTIIAAIKASEGVTYRYPFAIRLIK
jgi:uncharacterized Tic20 family protein